MSQNHMQEDNYSKKATSRITTIMMFLASCVAGYFVFTGLYDFFNNLGWLYADEESTRIGLTWILYFIMGITFLGAFAHALKMGDLPSGGLLIMVPLFWLIINVPTLIAYGLISNNINYLGWAAFIVVSIFAVIFTISLLLYCLSGLIIIFFGRRNREKYSRGPLGSSINESNSNVNFKKNVDIEDVEIKRERVPGEPSLEEDSPIKDVVK